MTSLEWVKAIWIIDLLENRLEQNWQTQLRMAPGAGISQFVYIQTYLRATDIIWFFRDRNRKLRPCCRNAQTSWIRGEWTLGSPSHDSEKLLEADWPRESGVVRPGPQKWGTFPEIVRSRGFEFLFASSILYLAWWNRQTTAHIYMNLTDYSWFKPRRSGAAFHSSAKWNQQLHNRNCISPKYDMHKGLLSY